MRLAVLALAISSLGGACSAGGDDLARTSKGPRHRAASAVGRPIATTSSDPTCPDARPVGRLLPWGLGRAIRREIPRAYSDFTAMGDPAWPHYVVVAVARLDRAYPSTTIPRLRLLIARHRAISRRLCGAIVANRSWVVFLYFPSAPAALLGDGIAYFARTPHGWRLWHRQV